MTMPRRFIMIGLFAIAIALYEVGMRSFLPVPYAYFFPALGIVSLGLFRGWSEEAFLFAFIVGGMHDVFRFQETFLFAGFPVLVAVLRFISLNVMTNRSVYSVIALVLLGRCCLSLWELSIHWIGTFFLAIHRVTVPWSEVWQRSAWDIAFVSLCFLLPLFVRRVLRFRRQSSQTYGSLL